MIFGSARPFSAFRGARKNVLVIRSGLRYNDSGKKTKEGLVMSSEAPDRKATREELLQENRELRQALQDAHAANAAKEAFLSNMSHDIRTPMNAIVGMTALARRYIDEKNRVADALEKIDTAAGHLLNLINDVLDMSRINSGRMKLTREAFSLSDLLHDVLIIIRPQMESRHHTFRLHAEEIPFENFFGDPLRIRQILVNVLSNAAKYTEDGGQVDFTVSGEAADGRCLLRFRCRDNGIGMTEEFLARIFEPFERVSSSTVSRIEGTGLGMSIVKKMTDAMEGTIQIASRPGEGTDIRIALPLEINHVETDVRNLADRRLLVLASDGEEGENLRRILAGARLDFTLAATMPEALSAITAASFDGRPYHLIALCPASESTEQTLELAAYLRDAAPEAGLVLISGDPWPQMESRANRAGIRHFIPLPVFRKTLLNGLNSALEGEESTGESAGPDLSGRRVLLAEDNPINLEIALELLSLTHVHTDTASNGQEAVEAYLASEKQPYDLILMDIQMPVMDGYQAAQAIRGSGRPDAASVPIYAMTANTFAEDISRALDAGMNGHIAKPVDIGVLMQVLRQVLRPGS